MTFLQTLNRFLWNGPMLVLLLGVHLYFTFHLKFIQKKTATALKLSMQPEIKPENDTSKETSSCSAVSKSGKKSSAFTALSTALAATLGTGNIIGVSTAVALGGPGAVFWCWLTGLLGMATSYAECYLSISFQRKLPDGSFLGGPMVVLHDILHKKRLGNLFAFLTVAAAFCVGCSTQAGAITDTVETFLQIPPYISGFILMLLCGYIILRGSQTVTKLCTFLVPFMALFYFAGCFYLLFSNHSYVLPALQCILKAAFSPTAVLGGMFGGSFLLATRYGIARGLFTNEAGLGSAPIAFASMNASQKERQALVSMTAVFWDTVIMCALTGIIIVSSILREPTLFSSYGSGELTHAAFSLLPFHGEALLGIILSFFAFATLIGWSFFGEKAALFLFGKDSIVTFRLCYIGMIFLGSILSFEFIWELTDFINACMMLPNLYCLFVLRKQIKPPN